MRTGPAVDGEDRAALRAEHDALAARLASRASIDDVRRGAYAAFAFVILGGIAAKLAYDRWGPYHPRAFRGPPIFFFLAAAAAVGLAAWAAVSFARARRRMRGEDADFARLRALRARLGLDP